MKRDFFKLGRIEFRCEVSPGNSIVVEPQEEPNCELVAIEDFTSPSPSLSRTPLAPIEIMETDSRLPGIQHLGHHPHQRHEEHHEFHSQHQHVQQSQVNRQSLPPPSTLRSPDILPHPTLQKAASNPPLPISSAVELVHELQPPIREAGVNHAHTLPSIVSHPSNIPGAPHLVNGHHYPRAPQQVQLDAIERLQTQISQNSSALAVQGRDIKQCDKSVQVVEENLRRELQSQVQRQNADLGRMNETIGRLYNDMQGMRQVIEGVSREMHALRSERQTRGTTVQGQHPSVQDSALELLAEQLATASQKVNEIDTLKLTIEIMKNKIQRLEGGASTTPYPQPTALPTTHSQPGSSAQPSHAVASYHNTSTPLPHLNTPVNPSQRSQPHPSGPTSTVTLEASQRPGSESEPGHNGWVTVNAGVKRTHTNGTESPHDVSAQSAGSPKRQKMATNDSHGGYMSSQGPPPAPNYDVQIHTQTHTLPSQPHAIPESVLTSQSQHSPYTPYRTQDGPSNDSWRPESQQSAGPRPRGRPRGSGRGGRGGRKSMPIQIHPVGTPEWEKEDWQSTPNSQMSPDGYHTHATQSAKGIARRGSGGGGRGGYTPNHAVSLGLQGVAAGMGTPSPDEHYGSAKKSRSKPIRNAEGILIRKDGRPDMRSQSSAANLRKVNMKKEESISNQDTNSNAPDTPSPGGYVGPEMDAATRKHHEIMGRVFPRGLDESRREHDYARQVFEDERGHTAQSRGQTHRAHQQAPAKHLREVKREQVEQTSFTDSQTPHHSDVDMDHEERSQTPTEQINHEEEEQSGVQSQTEQPKEVDKTIPEMQNVESSMTVAVETQTQIQT